MLLISVICILVITGVGWPATNIIILLMSLMELTGNWIRGFLYTKLN